MIDFQISVDLDQLRELRKELGQYGKRYRREIAIATNKAANKVRTNIAGEIYSELNATKGAIKKKIPLARRANARDVRGPRATASAIIQVVHEDRLRLAEFKPNHKRGGVSYKISRRKGRRTIPDAFMGPTHKKRNIKWMGGVFKRAGANPYPIFELYGVSPWGVFVKRRLKEPMRVEGREALRKELERRIRFIRLKNQGAI